MDLITRSKAPPICEAAAGGLNFHVTFLWPRYSWRDFWFQLFNDSRSSFSSARKLVPLISADGCRTSSCVDKSPQSVNKAVSVEEAYNFNVDGSND